MHPTRGAEGFRPEIEGLRGIAVVLVVLFHAGLITIPGGFVGVDVFFVISGFLITGLLIRERERTGAIRLPAFYARRVRRLLPAGMVTLALTLVAASVVLSPLDVPEVAADGAAAALSIGNVRFALEAGDYFASVATPSPFLHFWSLGVEEQFYLVWPAVILLAARRSRPRLGAGVALLVIVAVSFAANVVVADAAVNWAFYSLPTRAWQLGLGGLIALAADRIARAGQPVLALAGWAGVAAIVASAALIDGSVPYPGAYALVPTLGAVAVVAAGAAARGPAALLSLAPIRFLGRISYSLYLWHWPILVLPQAADWTPPAGIGLVLVGLSVVVAWATWRFIEEPFRTGMPSLAMRPVRTVFVGATAVVLVVSLATGLGAMVAVPGTIAGGSREQDTSDATDPVDLDDWPLETAPPTATPPAASPSVIPGSTGSGTPAGPVPSETPSPTARPTPTPVPVIRLPADVRPALAAARYDEERLRADGCLAFEGVTRPPQCRYGVSNGAVTVALVGDSHAAQWFPAVERIARVRGWQVRTFVKVACPFADMRVANLALKREYRECATWNLAVISELRALQPDLVLISMSRFAIHPVLDRDATVGAQGAALARFIDRLPGRVAVVVDTPEAGRDVPTCLARNTGDVRACAIPRSVAMSGDLGDRERIAARLSGAGLIDLTTRICPLYPAPVVVDGRIVFRDTRHLTATFARWLAPDLDAVIRRLVELT